MEKTPCGLLDLAGLQCALAEKQCVQPCDFDDVCSWEHGHMRTIAPPGCNLHWPRGAPAALLQRHAHNIIPPRPQEHARTIVPHWLQEHARTIVPP
eukprot:354917-Chlamydomonas_euryale.AAC.25